MCQRNYEREIDIDEEIDEKYSGCEDGVKRIKLCILKSLGIKV